MKSHAALVESEETELIQEEPGAAWPSVNVLGVRVDALNMEEALARLLHMLRRIPLMY